MAKYKERTQFRKEIERFVESSEGDLSIVIREVDITIRYEDVEGNVKAISYSLRVFEED